MSKYAVSPSDGLCGCEAWRGVAEALLRHDTQEGVREALARVGLEIGATRLRFFPESEASPRLPACCWTASPCRSSSGCRLADEASHSGDLSVPVSHRGRRFGVLVAEACCGGDAARLFLRDAAELIALFFLRVDRFAGRVPAPKLLRVGVGPFYESVSDRAILRIKSDADYSRVRLGCGRELLDSRPLSAWETVLSGGVFRRVHRCHIVNLGHFRGVNRGGGRWRLSLADGTEVPVGRSYRAEFRAELGLR